MQQPPVEVAELDSGAPRQRLPLVLLSALVLWAASATIFYTAPFQDEGSAALFALICCALSILAGLLTLLLRYKRISAFVAFGLIGCALGACACLQLLNGYAAADEGLSVSELRATQDSSKSDYGFSTLCQAACVNGVQYPVRVLTSEDESYLAGDVIACETELAPLKEEAKAFYRTQGICAQVRLSGGELVPADGLLGWLRSVRAAAINLIKESAGDAAPLFSAIVCGYRQDMSGTPLYDQFKACGLAHIVAVSGAHTAIVLMMLMWLLKALQAPRWLTALLSILFVLAYLVFAGLPISAIRSAVMSILAVTSFFARRRSASLNSIGLCVMAFIITAPSACLSVSLFLSAGSTLGIVLFAGLFTSWSPKSSERVRSLVVEPISLTFASNVATMPFSAALFSQASLIAPLANVVAAPIFALSCTAGLAACILGLLIPPAADLLIAGAAILVHLLMVAVEVLSLIPFASIACSLAPVPMLLASVVLCGVLWFFWPRPNRRTALVASIIAGTVCLVFVIASMLPKADEVRALDVGQGDAILVRSGTASVLIDTGNSDASLREELGAAGVHHLDAVIITHPDDDHCASLSSLGGYVEVDAICFAQDVWECGCAKCQKLIALADACAPFAEKQGLRTGDVLQAGRFALTVVWPDGFTDEGGNGDSVCLLGELDCDADGETDWRALFTGDAESEQLDAMLETGRVGDIDLLKVGHHGSRVSLTEEDVQQIRPEAALISVGAGNRYGHPTEEVLACLDSVGCNTFRTDESGTLSVTFMKEAMSITCER